MIQMVGLTKQFGTLTAVDNVTLHVRAGEVLALLGPNGAGKTTTVRMLSSILRPTAGQATVAGYDVVSQGHLVRQHVGVLTEAPGLYTRMTGREYLDFFGRIRGMPLTERQTRIAEQSAHFKLTSALDRRLSEYSKGMRQKISLVRTLLHNPPVLLLDEPTSAMDPEGARIVRDAIIQMRSDDQRAIIICTHNLSEAEELADRIAIISYGKIVKQGTLPELKKELLGPPLMELRFTCVPGCEKLAFLNDMVTVLEQDSSWLRYATMEPERVNPIILQKLADAHLPVFMLSEVPQSLEKVYLRVIEEGSDDTNQS
jgi:ABC-2 type transport system ATP-binding protein